MTNISDLPPELLFRILELVAENNFETAPGILHHSLIESRGRRLYPVCLVSRDWAHVGQRLLYQQPFLHDAASVATWDACALSGSCKTKALVLGEINVMNTIGSPIPIKHRDVVERCEGLETLVLGEPTDAKVLELPNLSGLTHLTLSGVSPVPEIVPTAYPFSLTSLVLGDDFLPTESAALAPLVHPLFASATGTLARLDLQMEYSDDTALELWNLSYIFFYPVTSQSYWLLSASANIGSTKISTLGTFSAIIDTGTSVIVAPTSAAAKYWAAVPNSGVYGSGYYTYPCASPPALSFSFGSTSEKWEISRDSLNLGRVSSGSSRCVGAIVGADIGVNAWIMGDAFLENVYTTFDLDTNKVGFSDLA